MGVANVAVVGSSVCRLITINQTDIKALVAYSSVVHMGMVIGRGCISSLQGVNFGLIIALAHGVCSSGLFYTATLTYSRVSSRRLTTISGMIIVVPTLALG